MERDTRDRLTAVFESALGAADPYAAVAARGVELSAAYEEAKCTRLFVLAFGKAVSPMLKAVRETMGDLVTGGIAITKYGYGVQGVHGVRVYEAGHPIPDESGLRATMEAVRLAGTFDERTLLVCLISGGGSALLVAPCPGVTLRQKQETTDLLLRAGADIYELNAVRKHLSMVKGGRLARLACPAAVESLILSDVMGDPLDVIASGPTAPDGTTYADAISVIEKYGLCDRVPREVSRLLADGAAGAVPETPKEGDATFLRVRNTIVANNGKAIEAARQKAGSLGLAPTVISRQVRGEARDAARRLAEKAREARHEAGPKEVCLISGGETTVTVKGRGLGGRNMELALAFAIEIDGEEGISLLSAATDGSDGPTDAAGAIVDGGTARLARARGIEPEKYLAENDSYRFFEKAGGLLRTGPTGTNVMDLQIMLVGGRAG